MSLIFALLAIFAQATAPPPEFVDGLLTRSRPPTLAEAKALRLDPKRSRVWLCWPDDVETCYSGYRGKVPVTGP